jgi:serine phosphatase RsbU (regulator of sigma subunit)
MSISSPSAAVADYGPLEIQLGAAKIAKYAVNESGDTLEVIERPQGGLSAVLVDGQRSGHSAKVISNIVARKAVSLLGEGVRDGAVARAVHDYLRTHRRGQVSAEVQMVSVDLATRTLVVSRNSRCPSHIYQGDTLQMLCDDSEPIGIYQNTKPHIVELPLMPYSYVLQYTDGLSLAFERREPAGIDATLMPLLSTRPGAQELADALLALALDAESGRPRDDISILVVAVLPDLLRNGVRRLSARFPV